MSLANPIRPLLALLALTGFAISCTAFLSAAEPDAPEKRDRIGTVLDKPVYRDQLQKGVPVPDELRRLFAGPVMAKYCQEHQADVTPSKLEIEEVAAHLAKEQRESIKDMEANLRDELRSIQDALKDQDLPANERLQLQLLERRLESILTTPGKPLAEFKLKSWKLQKHLYDNFGGGRILWQQAGIEAYDAMRTCLETQEKDGKFEFTDPEMRERFYAYWTTQDDSPFLTDDAKRIRKEFLEPEWLPPAKEPGAKKAAATGRSAEAPSLPARDRSALVAPDAQGENLPVSELIKRLKNTNPTPKAVEGGRGSVEFPRDYDWAAQTQVIDAWKVLDRRVEEALPELVQHLDDKDYCITFIGESSGGYSNLTVGDVCHRLVRSHVVPYLFSPDLPNPRWPWDADRTTLPKWLEKRAGQRLSEIQLEVVMKAKKHFKSVGRRKISKEDRARVIAELDEIAETINAGKPVRATSLGDGVAFRNYRHKSSRSRRSATTGGK